MQKRAEKAQGFKPPRPATLKPVRVRDNKPPAHVHSHEQEAPARAHKQELPAQAAHAHAHEQEPPAYAEERETMGHAQTSSPRKSIYEKIDDALVDFGLSVSENDFPIDFTSADGLDEADELATPRTQPPQRLPEKRSAAAKQKKKNTKKQRVFYGTDKDIVVMQEVNGDDGIFHRNGVSKTERWVQITERLEGLLGMEITAEGVRKHVEGLEKAHVSRINRAKSLSGREPVKTTAEKELEALVQQYIDLKEDERAGKGDQSKARKDAEDRAKGAAIRKAAVSREKPKSKPRTKPVNPFEFFDRLEREASERRETERRQRVIRESRMEERLLHLQELQVASQCEVANAIAKMAAAIDNKK